MGKKRNYEITSDIQKMTKDSLSYIHRQIVLTRCALKSHEEANISLRTTLEMASKKNALKRYMELIGQISANKKKVRRYACEPHNLK